MLIGEYKSTLGKKKRVSLPKKFREILGEKLILTRGYEQALIIVNEELWEKVAEEVMNEKGKKISYLVSLLPKPIT